MEIISEKPPLPIKLFEKGQLDAETKVKYNHAFACSGPTDTYKLWTANR